MKTLTRITCVVVLLAIGFAAGFPIGSTVGFTKGSEWALVQAAVLAKEAGLFMPVGFNGGMFRVILKQPRGVYRRAWQLADKNYDETMRRVATKSVKADEIVYVSHDQTVQAERSSQEVRRQGTDGMAYSSQDESGRVRQFLKEIEQQKSDEIVYASHDQTGLSQQFSQKEEQ
jgi:hypothetical protein